MFDQGITRSLKATPDGARVPVPIVDATPLWRRVRDDPRRADAAGLGLARARVLASARDSASRCTSPVASAEKDGQPSPLSSVASTMHGVRWAMGFPIKRATPSRGSSRPFAVTAVEAHSSRTADQRLEARLRQRRLIAIRRVRPTGSLKPLPDSLRAPSGAGQDVGARRRRRSPPRCARFGPMAGSSPSSLPVGILVIPPSRGGDFMARSCQLGKG